MSTTNNTFGGTAFDSAQHTRDVMNICGIFKEVTGKEATPSRESSAITHWLKKGWGLHDFRLIIEFCFSNPGQSEFFKTPGRMNLRNFLNPARGDILEDILLDLRHADSIQKKRDETRSPARELRLLMACGSKIYRADYTRHMEECFEAKGKCFYA